MAKIEILGAFAVTEDNQEAFFDLWDGDHADPQALATIINSGAAMIRIDHPDQPYAPNPTQEPDVEQWLWVHPKDKANCDKIIGLFMDVKDDGQGGFTEVPRGWIMGKTAAAVIIYKMGCCPQHSALLCGSFEDGFDFRIRDDRTTHAGHRQIFANMVKHDPAGHDLSHAYAHITNRDRACNHDKKVSIAPSQFIAVGNTFKPS